MGPAQRRPTSRIKSWWDRGEDVPHLLEQFLAHHHQNGSHNGLPESDLKSFIERHLQTNSGQLYSETLAQMERYLITRVLQETHGNQSKAAEILGITRGKIRDRIAAFGLKLEKEVSLTEGDA